MSEAKKTTAGLAAFAAMFLLNAPVFSMEHDSPSMDTASAADETADNNGGVPIYSGGIGDDEIAYIKSVQHQYDAKLVFTATNGEYLSDLPVNIRNKKGETVVSTVTNGPVLLVNLPAGSYTVSASQNGVSHEQKISVTPHKLQVSQFRFNEQGLVTSEGY